MPRPLRRQASPRVLRREPRRQAQGGGGGRGDECSIHAGMILSSPHCRKEGWQFIALQPVRGLEELLGEAEIAARLSLCCRHRGPPRPGRLPEVSHLPCVLASELLPPAYDQVAVGRIDFHPVAPTA